MMPRWVVVSVQTRTGRAPDVHVFDHTDKAAAERHRRQLLAQGAEDYYMPHQRARVFVAETEPGRVR